MLAWKCEDATCRTTKYKSMTNDDGWRCSSLKNEYFFCFCLGRMSCFQTTKYIFGFLFIDRFEREKRSAKTFLAVAIHRIGSNWFKSGHLIVNYDSKSLQHFLFFPFEKWIENQFAFWLPFSHRSFSNCSQFNVLWSNSIDCRFFLTFDRSFCIRLSLDRCRHDKNM